LPPLKSSTGNFSGKTNDRPGLGHGSHIRGLWSRGPVSLILGQKNQLLHGDARRGTRGAWQTWKRESPGPWRSPGRPRDGASRWPAAAWPSRRCPGPGEHRPSAFDWPWGPRPNGVRDGLGRIARRHPGRPWRPPGARDAGQGPRPRADGPAVAGKTAAGVAATGSRHLPRPAAGPSGPRRRPFPPAHWPGAARACFGKGA
jgi:hypothetical protein